jgi:hypothetical protein
MSPEEANDQTAELARRAMIAFAQDVMAIQLHNVNREETGYNVHAFDWACDGFLAGALMTISEVFQFPTPPREVAFLGLIAYLTEIKGMKFKRARERASLLYNAPEGSKAAFLFELGQEWRRTDALKVYFQTQPPGEGASQVWTDSMQRRAKYFWSGLAAIAILVTLVVHYSLGL